MGPTTPEGLKSMVYNLDIEFLYELSIGVWITRTQSNSYQIRSDENIKEKQIIGAFKG